MSRVSSFAPIEPSRSRLLILGSMPGEASLAVQQYYAHPRNAFWPILGAWLGMPPAAPYAQRVEALRRAGIAVWDVLDSCVRPGSLDARIDWSSAQANDIPSLLRRHRGIRTVMCNGSTAHAAFRRLVLPAIDPEHRPEVVALPSTSPAHAARSLAQKAAIWHAALREAGIVRKPSS